MTKEKETPARKQDLETIEESIQRIRRCPS